MSLDANKALVRRHYQELLNGWNLDLVDEIFSPDYVHHHPARDGLRPGLQGVKQFLRMSAAAFPNNHIRIEDMIAEGDKVVVRACSQGTHSGTYRGIPATGKFVTKHSIDIFRIHEGKFVEHWDLMDELGIWEQLGMIGSQQRTRTL